MSLMLVVMVVVFFYDVFDFDLMLIGVFFYDLGKVFELIYDCELGYSDEG